MAAQRAELSDRAMSARIGGGEGGCKAGCSFPPFSYQILSDSDSRIPQPGFRFQGAECSWATTLTCSPKGPEKVKE